MRWILGILKILFVAVVLAVTIKAAVTYIPPVKNSFDKYWSYSPRKNGTESEHKQEREIQSPDSAPRSGDNDLTGDKSSTDLKSDQKNRENILSGDKDKENRDKYYLTQDEIYSIASNISLSDRAAGLAIAGKMKKADIEKLVKLAADGVTYGEMQQINEVLEASLNKTDVAKLYNLLLKNRKIYAEGKLGR